MYMYASAAVTYVLTPVLLFFFLQNIVKYTF